MRQFRILGCGIMFGVMLAALTGCASDIPKEPSAPEPGTPVSSAIQELISDYYESIHPETRALGHGFSIVDIDTQIFDVNGQPKEASAITRGTSDSDFSISTVKIDFGKSTGYAILSDDERINRVFYFTENGEIGDTAYIAPLKDIIESYPAVAKDIIVENGFQTRTDSDITVTLIDNIVPFSWGQGVPFNACAPYCTCSKCSQRSNHQLSGCTTVAISQYLAKRGVFEGTYYPNKHVDFSNYPTYGFQMTNGQIDHVVTLFREVAHNCQIKFGCDASSGQIKATFNYLRELGIDCELVEGDIDYYRVKSELEKGIPHIIRGQNDGGHIWLVTGIRELYNNNIHSGMRDYYCNWGWNGYSDGWSIGNPFTPKSEAPYKKSIKHIYTRSW